MDAERGIVHIVILGVDRQARTEFDGKGDVCVSQRV